MTVKKTRRNGTSQNPLINLYQAHAKDISADFKEFLHEVQEVFMMYHIENGIMPSMEQLDKFSEVYHLFDKNLFTPVVVVHAELHN